MKPTVGRIVHYYAGIGDTEEPRAAIVISVWHNEVRLRVFDDKDETVDVMDEPRQLSWERGWEWPPRVKPLAGRG